VEKRILQMTVVNYTFTYVQIKHYSRDDRQLSPLTRTCLRNTQNNIDKRIYVTPMAHSSPNCNERRGRVSHTPVAYPGKCHVKTSTCSWFSTPPLPSHRQMPVGYLTVTASFHTTDDSLFSTILSLRDVYS
jgi:hypothetical protein